MSTDTATASCEGDAGPCEFIVGRAEIAHRLGRSERTVSRWIARGILKATNAGPFGNNLLKVSAAELERLA
jgi:transposase